MNTQSSRLPYQPRPSYPHLASPISSQSHSTSAFQSSSSLSSVRTMDSSSSTSSPATLQPPYSAPAFSRGPMPSPSAESNNSSYFVPLSPTTSQTQYRHQQPQIAHQSQPQYSLHQPRFAAQQSIQAQPAQQFLGQRGDGSGSPVTAPFLQDFSLLAEAAKRAEMHCLARDLDDIGL